MKNLSFAPFLLAVAALCGAAPAFADNPITLDVDLSDAARQLFHGHEVMPVKAGALTLYYPKWIPGEHSPSGPLENLAGLKISAGGKPIAWRRDLTDMYSFHVTVPAGVSSLDIDYEFLSPDSGGEFGQSVSSTPAIVDLEWNQLILYPAGTASKDIQFTPSVKLPEGWQFGTALDTESSSGGTTHFKTVALNKLVDSPLIAGLHFRRIDLSSDSTPVHIDIVADTDEELAVTAQETQALRNLVKQANTLFGAHHYDHYDFLFTISANTGHFGLEHHQSSDDRSAPDFFIDPSVTAVGAGLLPHEYVHSWNGKFRRPADLWTADFNTTPMQGDLLWVYEGLTEYLGQVLTARSGLFSAQQYRDALAITAAEMDHTPGRGWRPLQDTADEAQVLYYAPREWANYRRLVDYYPEGELLWLDVDTKLRELSEGRKSIDDFTHVFFGMDNGSYVTKTYGFDDIVAALNQVQPFDWAGFLRQRLDSTQPGAPLDGISRGGYVLKYSEVPTQYYKDAEKLRKSMNLMYSIGLSIGMGDHSMGEVYDVLWGGPAYKAGIGPGMHLVAVNGRAFDADKDVLPDAITAAKTSKTPIRLLFRNQDEYMSFDVDYHEGLKYPYLYHAQMGKASLDAIIAAH